MNCVCRMFVLACASHYMFVFFQNKCEFLFASLVAHCIRLCTRALDTRTHHPSIHLSLSSPQVRVHEGRYTCERACVCSCACALCPGQDISDFALHLLGTLHAHSLHLHPIIHPPSQPSRQQAICLSVRPFRLQLQPPTISPFSVCVSLSHQV